MKKIILSLVLISAPLAILQAANVTVQWDANTESNLAGYRLFDSTRSLANMTTAQALNDATVIKTIVAASTTTKAISLTENATHYIRLTAFNTSNQESLFSNQVSTFIADRTPPTVSIVSPANGSTVKGTINIVANASDNVGIKKVDFYSNGNLIKSDSVAPYGLTTDTTLSSNGPRTLSVRAYDLSNNMSASTITFTIFNGVDTTPPTVSLVSPANGSTVSGTINIVATASDNVGIQKVEFYSNGRLIKSDSVAPYGLTTDTTLSSNGPRILSARAYDLANNISASTITFTISNSGVAAPAVSVLGPPLLPAPTIDLAGLQQSDQVIRLQYPNYLTASSFVWTLSPASSAKSSAAASSTVPSIADNAKSYTTTKPELDIRSLKLPAGNYTVSVYVMDASGNASQTAQATFAVIADNFAALSVFPNPWQADKHQGMPITFANLPADATIKIFSTSGQWVKTLTSAGGSAVWDLKNDDSDAVASGVYFYLASSSQDSHKRGKFAVIK